MKPFRFKDPLQIIAFYTYGTNTHLYARGRAMEDENINLSAKSAWKLLLNTWRRFDTDEVGSSPVALVLPDGTKYDAMTDADGFFLIDAQHSSLERFANSEGWVSFEIFYSAVEQSKRVKMENRFPGEFLIPSEKAKFGVISDIDDTILHTGVVSSLKWQVIKNTMFKRPEKRIPLEGAASFLRQLHKGGDGTSANPVFYVSHSPWNLYRYLLYFLEMNHFPKGPILLRNFKSFLLRKKEKEKPQKQKEILNILKTYPDMPFILIGDSGERDADIYIEIAETHPNRVLAIYLRSVRHRKRHLRVQGLFENYKTTPVLLARDSDELIDHARKHGFIADDLVKTTHGSPHRSG
jgi:phosphatidate phosphatase APP1